MKRDQLEWRSSASVKALFLYSGVLQHAAESGTHDPLKATKESTTLLNPNKGKQSSLAPAPHKPLTLHTIYCAS